MNIQAENGYFGEFGGIFIPEILQSTFDELINTYNSIKEDEGFWREFHHYLETYSSRPTPITHAENLSNHFQGPQIYIKREDLNHTGAHKFNNVLGQALLAKRMKKKRIIAETGAGQHGVATATIAAKFGFECTVYMGAVDMARQQPNVFWMEKLGAEVIGVSDGSKTLKDAVNAAFKDWVSNPLDSHYILGTACGPHPFPEMVSRFQKVIGDEARSQILSITDRLPSSVYACVGGGSNALGIFQGFLNDLDVKLIGVEAGGLGLSKNKHASRIASNCGSVGVVQGYKTYFLQSSDGQTESTHSIAAGLDYVGISPILSHLHKLERVIFLAATDDEVLYAHKLLMQKEGLITALESAHAFAGLFADINKYNEEDVILINQSGRGDKDIFTIAEAYNDSKWKDYIVSISDQYST
jgi:tryptophan synthase beta chain